MSNIQPKTQLPDRQKQKYHNQRQKLTENQQLLHNHQDTIFSSLYSDPKCVLDLYLTLHPEDRNLEITPDQVKLITLENIFLVQRHNNVAFQIGNKLIVLVEHQSIINKNMPLRMLFYVASKYEKIISAFKKKLYWKKLIQIPKPEFYIVYTGKTPWRQKELKLSEAYSMSGLEDIPLEVTVQILSEDKIHDTQNTLSNYYHFIRFIKENAIDNKISTDAVENYILQFVGSELFKGFLETLDAEEVNKMTNYEFDLEEAMEAWRDEGIEEGIEQTTENVLRNLMDTMKLTLNQAMDAIKIPAEDQPMYIARIQKQ